MLGLPHHHIEFRILPVCEFEVGPILVNSYLGFLVAASAVESVRKPKPNCASPTDNRTGVVLHAANAIVVAIARHKATAAHICSYYAAGALIFFDYLFKFLRKVRLHCCDLLRILQHFISPFLLFYF
jgi:hypothetical protein